MTIKAMVRGINGRLKIRCGMPGIGSGLARFPQRCHLYLTTSRQSEQGRGRRHLPDLCPPDHVGPQPPERGIHPAQVRP
jgi:hypothetical protein